jgi:hypothetical protein
MREDLRTFFLDTEGRLLGDEQGIIPISLYKGMMITLHRHADRFEVLDWSYHHGQPAEGAGLRIILKRRD